MQSFVQEYTNINKSLKLHKKCKLTTQTTVLIRVTYCWGKKNKVQSHEPRIVGACNAFAVG